MLQTFFSDLSSCKSSSSMYSFIYFPFYYMRFTMGMWRFNVCHSPEYMSQHLRAHHVLCCLSAHCWRTASRQPMHGWKECEMSLCSAQYTISMCYHGETSYLPNSHVELPQVQRLLAHSGQLCNGRASLLHEGQVSLHPGPPLRLNTQLIKSRDSLPTDRGGVRVGFLGSDREREFITYMNNELYRKKNSELLGKLHVSKT